MVIFQIFVLSVQSRLILHHVKEGRGEGGGGGGNGKSDQHFVENFIIAGCLVGNPVVLPRRDVREDHSSRNPGSEYTTAIDTDSASSPRVRFAVPARTSSVARSAPGISSKSRSQFTRGRLIEVAARTHAHSASPRCVRVGGVAAWG